MLEYIAMAYRLKEESRIEFLVEASKILSSSLDYHVTLANVAKLLVDNMADFCMIDLLDESGKMERAAAKAGDPRKVQLANKMFEFPADPRNVGGIYDTARIGRPVLVEKVQDRWLKGVAKITEERIVLKKLGIKSLIYAPLKGRGIIIGVLTLVSSKENFSYTEDDVILAEEIANRAELAVAHARLYLEAQEALEGEKELASNLRFLSESSKILSSSLDYKTTLANVAKLAVSHITDWCGVDMLNENGEIEQVAISHRDPKKIRLAKELRKERPVNMADKFGLPSVLRTGKSELYSPISEDILTSRAKSKKELELLKKLNLTSAMIVPLLRNKKVIGTISFITEEGRERYDRNSLIMAEELASRASLAIENSRLYQVAQDAIRSREEFMSIAGHELRTPLTIILLHLQKANSDIKKLMAKHTGMEKIPDLLERSEKQGFRLSKMINDLLDVSLINTDKLRLEKEHVDLNIVVEEVLQLFSIQLKKVKTFIIYDRSNEPIMGHWDRIRLEQVISNLISNAFKYGKRNPVNVSVKKVGQEALIEIRDKGIGIKPEDIENIFELFKRGVSPEDFKGIGIGLYISKRIVESHGGKIEVRSKAGIGSTFTIRLPLISN